MRSHRAIGVISLIAGLATTVAGLEITICDPLTAVPADGTVESAGNEMRIVAPANGIGSGLMVVRGVKARGVDVSFDSSAIRGVAARDLFQVRYGRLGPGLATNGDGFLRRPAVEETALTHFDMLDELPPRDTDVVPVWITARVPADFRPGTYDQLVTVNRVRVAIKLTVCEFRMPSPRDWRGHAGLIGAEHELAQWYAVEPWSEEHWRLVERQFALAGLVGPTPLRVTVFADNSSGEEHATVRFKRVGMGEFQPDLSIVERLFDLYSRHVGSPDPIIVEAWCPFAYRRLKDGAYRTSESARITVTDGGGRLYKERAPLPDEPGSDAIWGPVMDGIRDLARARGWAPESIVIGTAVNGRPRRGTVDLFKRIAPYAKWGIWLQGYEKAEPPRKGEDWIIDDVPIGYCEVDTVPVVRIPQRDEVVGGWQGELCTRTTARRAFAPDMPLSQYWLAPDATTVGVPLAPGGMHTATEMDSCGLARLRLGGWTLPVAPGRTTENAAAEWAGKELYKELPKSLLYPGLSGPVSSIRYELLREGYQALEARIVIEKALVDKQARGDLALRCRELLLERATSLGGQSVAPGSALAEPESVVKPWRVPEDRHESLQRLYDLAEEVTAATGKRRR